MRSKLLFKTSRGTLGLANTAAFEMSSSSFPEAAYAAAGPLELRLVAGDVLLLAELLNRRDDLVLPDGVLEALLERRPLPGTVLKGPFTYDVRK